MIDQEYYKRVKTSEEFYRRKKLILLNLEKLQKKVEVQARNFDDYAKLKFIVLEKAKQKKSIVKNFVRLEHFRQTNSSGNRFFEDEQARQDFDPFREEDDSQTFDDTYGLENEFTRDLRQRIDNTRKTKGRGLLLSFFEFNQEVRIPKLIRAMKQGFRVALVSDAGTPTISDPGFMLVREARESGVQVEALPGACAVTTAVSSSGFPADKFQFFGYLPKTQGEREDALLEIKRSQRTTAVYENPNRLVRTLLLVEQIFGPAHKVFVGLELTKRHERNLRDGAQRVRQQIEEHTEGARLKGEVTLVLAPWAEEGEERLILQGQQFDPNRDAQVRVDIMRVAKKLNEQVQMSEGEFRDLIKGLFGEVPTQHVNQIVRLTRQGGKQGRMAVIQERLKNS
mmetsp:Transcript_4366/g.7373  ORF Transcript_4366/g.7373 Transcript_4366/m.7373 type:complete len:396 (-) Transcript_4366:46-1233(-)